MKHLFTLDLLLDERILSLVKRSSVFKCPNKDSTIKVKNFVVGILSLFLFFEPLTRTKYSFQIAVKRLGGQLLSFYRG